MFDYHEPIPGADPAPASEPALTVADVAASLAAEINSSFIAAMQAGVPAVARGVDPRPPSLLTLLESFISVPVYAQGTGFVANCSHRGNVRIQYLGAAPDGGRLTLSNTPVTFSDCTHSLNGRGVTHHGTLTASVRSGSTAPRARISSAPSVASAWARPIPRRHRIRLPHPAPLKGLPSHVQSPFPHQRRGPPSRSPRQC
jgi:hypothetical protein